MFPEAFVRAPKIALVAALSGCLGAVAAVSFLEARRQTLVAAGEPPAPLAAPANDPSQSFRQVAKLVRPSVVNLTRERVVAEEPNPFEEMFERYFNDRDAPRRSLKERAFGTGFIVRADGLVLTNNHVAGGGGKLTARLASGVEVEATVVGADPLTDVAVVRLAAEGKPYSPVGLADSDAVEVGDWAIAFGCPFGLEQTVTVGVISAKGRSHVGIVAYEDFLQTDAAINPGNSGGPLVDIHGQVIGINTAIASRSGGYQGVGFTIPINMAKTIMEKIVADGRVVRGWLGIGLPQDDERGAKGAVVKTVAAGGPAEKAGIQPGDQVTAFDGKPVPDSNRLRFLVAEAAVGKTVRVKLLRDGKEIELPVTIGERTPDAERARLRDRAPAPAVGITAKRLTPELAKRFSLPEDSSGIVVTEVSAGSLAAEAGVKAGQIIRSVDGRAIETIEDLDAAVSSMNVTRGVRLVLEDAAGRQTVILRAR
jgi:serine protease Do